MIPLSVIEWLLLVVPVAIVALVVSWGPVARRRVRRFAGRHRLPITVDNGADVIGYLAHVRRWRARSLLTARFRG